MSIYFLANQFYKIIKKRIFGWKINLDEQDIIIELLFHLLDRFNYFKHIRLIV